MFKLHFTDSFSLAIAISSGIERADSGKIVVPSNSLELINCVTVSVSAVIATTKEPARLILPQ